jgi:uncharacterized protein (DUF433 family)
MKMLPGRIVIDPKICGGKPIFKGTRIPVYVVLEMLPNQEKVDEILTEYPNLNKTDVQDAIIFARNVAEIPGNPASAA